MKLSWRIAISLSALFVSAAMTQGCGSGSSSGSFPSISPPVKAAVPAGFGGTASIMDEVRVPYSLSAMFESAVAPFNNKTLPVSTFNTDFFQTGPTVLLNITGGVDNRASAYTSSSSSCKTATPVSYKITPAGQSAAGVTMYASCSQQINSGFTGDPGVVLYGTQGGNFYVYQAVGTSWTAAILTPDGSSFDVHLWYSVGIGNGIAGSNGGQCGTVGQFDSCSYGVAEVLTNAASSTFQMSAAGVNMGYCGVQLGSDGTNTFAKGSAGVGGSCAGVDSVCVLSKDEQTAATGGICSSATPFGNPSATPSTGTVAIGISTGAGKAIPTIAASTYPTSTNVTLDGTSTDAVHFGPTSIPAGVASL